MLVYRKKRNTHEITVYLNNKKKYLIQIFIVLLKDVFVEIVMVDMASRMAAIKIVLAMIFRNVVDPGGIMSTLPNSMLAFEIRNHSHL